MASMQYEGCGDVGLAWLKNAGKETGLPVTTEVANAAHVEAALKALRWNETAGVREIRA